MIRLLADQQLAPLAEAMINDPNQRRWLLGHTGNRFRPDPANQSGVAATSIVPQFFGEVGNADSLPAIPGWTGALLPALDLQYNHLTAHRLYSPEVPLTLV